MTGGAYYNEIDPKAAAWLRELIKNDLIAPGEVDERSIVDVTPADLAGFRQCHFFAGIGVWSYALRLAGWPDDRPVWTGSCPCQPFSAAGKGKGTADERHLWPAFFHLISQCQPPVVFGEQVASKGGLGWLDLVQADLEGSGYAVGAIDSCAAGFGAPLIRQRLYFAAILDGMGYSVGEGLEGHRRDGDDGDQSGRERKVSSGSVAAPGSVSGLADDNPTGLLQLGQTRLHGRRQGEGSEEPAEGGADRPLGDDAARRGEDGGMADPGHDESPGRDGDANPGSGAGTGDDARAESAPRGTDGGAGPTNGHWGAADWLFCRDGKWRPVRPGSFPLVDGAPARVGRLRGYGNAIVAQQAQAWIEAFLEVED